MSEFRRRNASGTGRRTSSIGIDKASREDVCTAGGCRYRAEFCTIGREVSQRLMDKSFVQRSRVLTI